VSRRGRLCDATLLSGGHDRCGARPGIPTCCSQSRGAGSESRHAAYSPSLNVATLFSVSAILARGCRCGNSTLPSLLLTMKGLCACRTCIRSPLLRPRHWFAFSRWTCPGVAQGSWARLLPDSVKDDSSKVRRSRRSTRVGWVIWITCHHCRPMSRKLQASSPTAWGRDALGLQNAPSGFAPPPQAQGVGNPCVGSRPWIQVDPALADGMCDTVILTLDLGLWQ